MTAVDQTNITNGTLTIDLTANTVSYGPNGEFEFLDVGEYNTTQSFNYTLTDVYCAKVPPTPISTLSPYTALLRSQDDNVSFTEDAAASLIVILTNDSDPDDPLNMTAVDQTNITNGTLAVTFTANTV